MNVFVLNVSDEAKRKNIANLHYKLQCNCCAMCSYFECW
jgi:hypothetical protein